MYLMIFIKNRYFIVVFVSLEGFISISYHTNDKLNLFSHFNEPTVEISLQILKSDYQGNGNILASMFL